MRLRLRCQNDYLLYRDRVPQSHRHVRLPAERHKVHLVRGQRFRPALSTSFGRRSCTSGNAPPHPNLTPHICMQCVDCLCLHAVPRRLLLPAAPACQDMCSLMPAPVACGGVSEQQWQQRELFTRWCCAHHCPAWPGPAHPGITHAASATLPAGLPVHAPRGAAPSLLCPWPPAAPCPPPARAAAGRSWATPARPATS